jgi:hypothetical protein
MNINRKWAGTYCSMNMNMNFDMDVDIHIYMDMDSDGRILDQQISRNNAKIRN